MALIQPDLVRLQFIPIVELDLSLQNSGGLDLLEDEISPSIKYIYKNFDTVNGGACQYFDTNIILLQMENRVLIPQSSDIQITNPTIGNNGSFSFTFKASVNINDNVCLICSFFSEDYYPLTTCLNINVKAPPQVKLKIKPDEISTGDTVVITCKFSGFPFPEFEFNPKRIVPYSDYETISLPTEKLKILKYTAVIRKIDASWDGEVIQCLTKPNSDFAGIIKENTLRVHFRERRRNGPWILILIGVVTLALLILILLAAGYSMSRRRRSSQCPKPEGPQSTNVVSCSNPPCCVSNGYNTLRPSAPMAQVQSQEYCAQNCKIDDCYNSKINTQPTMNINQKLFTYPPACNHYKVSGSAYI